MPTFTRAVLAPALMRFTSEHPQVNVRITEAYSGVLERAVGDEDLDFALVPPGHTQPSVRSSHLATDREFLVTSLDSDRENLSSVQLGPESPPLRLILPGSINARRGRIESYVQGCGARIEAIIEMDAMMGTLELIAQSDWSAIVPGVLCAPDRDGRARKVHPLVKPEFEVSYFLIEPAKRSMTPAARLFAEVLAAEIKRLVAEAAE
jgi:DNA-binding transcriptional LysR family regulator